MSATVATQQVEFPVRNGRNLLALAVLVPLTGLALLVGLPQALPLGPEDWWIGVFPVLTAMGVYRTVRRRVPLAVEPDGLRVATGHRLLGLRATLPWSEVKRLRILASGLLLVDLQNATRWAADKPWLVRANVRANERKFNAAVVQPLRELAGTPAEIVSRLRAAAPVRVDAPQGMVQP